MSDWSSYEDDKEIADKWRQFLTEDKQLDEGVLDTVKAKASAARTKAAAATGAAKKGIGKVTGTKAAAARNIKARKVSDWLHGKPQKMRTMNTKFGAGAGQAGGSQSGGSESPGTGVSSRAADPDFDASEKKYLGADSAAAFDKFAKEIIHGVFMARLAGAERIEAFPEETKELLDNARRSDDPQAHHVATMNLQKRTTNKIKKFMQKHLVGNGYRFGEAPAAEQTPEQPAEETAEPVAESRKNRKKTNQKKQDAAAKAKKDAARDRSMIIQAANTIQKGAVPISALEAFLKLTIDEKTAAEAANSVWGYFKQLTALANT